MGRARSTDVFVYGAFIFPNSKLESAYQVIFILARPTSPSSARYFIVHGEISLRLSGAGLELLDIHVQFYNHFRFCFGLNAVRNSWALLCVLTMASVNY